MTLGLPPAWNTLLVSGWPMLWAMKREASRTLSRLMPCSIPRPSSRYSRSSVATLPAAPGPAKGQPPRPPAELSNLSSPRSRLARMLASAVDIGAAEALGRCDEQRNVLYAGSQSAVQSARIRHQRDVADARLLANRAKDFVRVSHLRHRARMNKGRRLDPLVARVRKQVDVANLGLGRDWRGFVLEAIARTDLDDSDVLRLHPITLRRSRSQAGVF